MNYENYLFPLSLMNFRQLSEVALKIVFIISEEIVFIISEEKDIWNGKQRSNQKCYK